MSKLLHSSNIVRFCLLAVVLIFFVYPVVKTALTPELKDYIYIITRPRTLRAIQNSAFITVLSTITAVIIGFCFAFVQHYTNTSKRLKVFLHWVTIIPLLSPPFIIALAWILLFGPRGLVTAKLFKTSFNIMGWRGLWLVQSIAFYPYAYLTLYRILQMISPELEAAANNLGSSKWRIFRDIVLPLALPGIASAFLLVGVYVLADFGNPIFIAGEWPVLPTLIYGRISGYYDIRGASSLAMILLVPTVIMYLLSRWLMQRREVSVITGRGSDLPHTTYSGWLKVALVAFCLAIAITILAVYGSLVLGAFVQTWGVHWKFTFQHWYALRGPIGRTFINSLIIGLFAGTGAAIFSSIASDFIYRQRFRFQTIWDFLIVLPAAVPGLSLGIGYLLAFNHPPFVLTGTWAILVIALLIWNIPLTYQTCVAALEQIGKELDEAAFNLGAGAFYKFLTVSLPLLKSPVFGGFIMGFLRAITNLSIVIFLISPGSNVATAEILNLYQYGEIGQALVLTICLFGSALAVISIVQAVFVKGGELFVKLQQ